MQRLIQFNIPLLANKELTFVDKTIKNQNYTNNGYFNGKCRKILKDITNSKDVLLVNSCTAALEMCALLLNIKFGDEIIMPSYTFVSTANAFILRGGTPIFVDIDKETLNIDPDKIEEKITKKTKAIVVVHYAGISCDLNKVINIAKKFNLYVIEDAAQALGSQYYSKPLGSIGDLGAFSFHESKNLHCGSGGALLINNKKFIKRAKIILNKGTNRDEFNKRKINKYTWHGIGSSYELDEIRSAFLYAQLINYKEIIKNRNKSWNNYHKLFHELDIEKKLKRPVIPRYSLSNSHIYFLIVNQSQRNKILKYFKNINIQLFFHYMPLHLSKFYKKNFNQKIKLKNTEYISKSIIRLPMHYKLTFAQQKKIKNIIKKFLNKL